METRIPRYIDDPAQFLFWDLDEALILIGSFCFGILLGYPFWGGLAGIASGRALRKLRSGKAEGYFWHALYWVGIVKGRPPGHIREMVE